LPFCAIPPECGFYLCVNRLRGNMLSASSGVCQWSIDLLG
jgi:hypothetical protein